MSTTHAPSTPNPIRDAANKLALETDSDVYFFNSGIERPYDQNLIDCIAELPHKRSNIIFVLVTEGGDPDAAYRMARCMQDHYERVTCIVPGFCKSAGTLLVIGASELVMGDSAELGPVDVQMAKRDELGEWQSGLTISSAMQALHERAFAAFEHFFLTTKQRSLNRITFRTATDIAAKLTGALFAPIFQQIDPFHVGEANRSTAIALYYGTRLDVVSDNLKPDALDDLISEYPHHGFVIDRKEAATLFKQVREFTDTESSLIEALGRAAKIPLPQEYTRREFLSDPFKKSKEEAHDTGESTDAGTSVSQTAAESAPAPAAEPIQQDGHKAAVAAP